MANDIIPDSLRKDIASIQSELARLAKVVSAQGTDAYYEVRDGAEKAADSIVPAARNAAEYVKSEASSVASAVREHPAATTSVLTTVGLIGFAIGYLVGTTTATDRSGHWYDRYR